MSGNSGINTHLSEVLSELLEPIVNNKVCAEVSSTEEAICEMENVNKHIQHGNNIDTLDGLMKYSDMSRHTLHNPAPYADMAHDIQTLHKDQISNSVHTHDSKNNKKFNVSARDEEEEILDTLLSLEKEGCTQNLNPTLDTDRKDDSELALGANTARSAAESSEISCLDRRNSDMVESQETLLFPVGSPVKRMFAGRIQDLEKMADKTRVIYKRRKQILRKNTFDKTVSKVKKMHVDKKKMVKFDSL